MLCLGGDVAIKLSYVLERCPNFDPDSSSSWFADAAAAQDYSVLAKWGRMTGDFDEYTTRLSNALNEIGSVRLQLLYLNSFPNVNNVLSSNFKPKMSHKMRMQC